MPLPKPQQPEPSPKQEPTTPEDNKAARARVRTEMAATSDPCQLAYALRRLGPDGYDVLMAVLDLICPESQDQAFGKQD